MGHDLRGVSHGRILRQHSPRTWMTPEFVIRIASLKDYGKRVARFWGIESASLSTEMPACCSTIRLVNVANV